MQTGQIFVAQYEGTFVIKLVGDVRLTLVTSFDDFFNRMFTTPGFVGVAIDLSEAVGIDSTTLGLLAKLAIHAKNNYKLVPMVVCPNRDIDRLLKSMGFDKIFDICEDSDPRITEVESLDELPAIEADEQSVKIKIIEAHRILMDLNEKNRNEFSDLVAILESTK